MARTSSRPSPGPASEKARRTRRTPNAKARVTPQRARVKPQPKNSPALTKALPPSQQTRQVLATRHSPLATRRRHPLFVLSMARRRRARGGTVRGGYYRISSVRGKERGLSKVVAAVVALFGTFWLFTLGLLVAAGLATWGAYEYFAKDLPSIDNIHGIQFETTHIYDRHGNLLYEMFDTGVGKRNYVTIDRMPQSLINATIAAEDETFEKNNGVDPKGILRAAYINMSNKGS